MKIKAVLFDIDGTLVDSNEGHIKAWKEAFEAAGRSFSESAIGKEIGKGTDKLVPSLMPDADETLQEKLGKAHGAIFGGRYLGSVRPFSKAQELLQRVHQSGRKVVLASSASNAELDYYVALLGLKGIVTAQTTADDVESTKPAPDIFGVALKKIAPITAEEAIVVGDTPYDVEAARKLGIASIAVRSGGFSDETLRAAGATAIYDDVAALLADLDSSPLAQ